MRVMEDFDAVRQRFSRISGALNERLRRLFAATEAEVLGYGGVSLVARATGVSRRAITEGLAELSSGVSYVPDKTPEWIRRPGGGRKKAVVLDTTLQSDLESLIEPLTRGDPQSPLRWTCQSLRQLATQLTALGNPVSHTLVGELLRKMGYSLQANQKTKEGATHPDRNAQFKFINARTKKELAAGNPVISVDTKKKELVGDFKNRGRTYRAKGNPEKVRVHDFSIPELRRVEAEIDHTIYPAGQKVSDEQMAQINLTMESFHGEWNYTIAPLQQQLKL